MSWGIRAIWEHYAGWFKHESTTELYCVPQKAVHADVVELAGTDHVVQRAQQKASVGQPEQALHLLDIVLNAEPDHAGARALAIQVHETLLADAETFCTTGNFWLVGWLQNQIKLLKGGATAPLVVQVEALSMSDLRIADLANPVFTEVQKRALEFGETLATSFDPEGLLAEASDALGLTDYGPNDFRERLDLICDEWDNDNGLTGIGRYGLRQRLLGYAKNRLLIQDILNASSGNPRHRDQGTHHRGGPSSHGHNAPSQPARSGFTPAGHAPVGKL